jgi:hypothetical protein
LPQRHPGESRGPEIHAESGFLLSPGGPDNSSTVRVAQEAHGTTNDPRFPVNGQIITTATSNLTSFSHTGNWIAIISTWFASDRTMSLAFKKRKIHRPRLHPGKKLHIFTVFFPGSKAGRVGPGRLQNELERFGCNHYDSVARE